MTGNLDEVDRSIVAATQAGLPLVERPYAEVAHMVGLSEADVLERIAALVANGIIRRIGLVPNHYALGLTHNAMTVWDIDDRDIMRLGRDVGSLDFVTHCYQRPRRLPLWPYNLFAMVHGHSAGEVEEKTHAIARLLGTSCRARDVLVSTRILKKTGMRLKRRAGQYDAAPLRSAEMGESANNAENETQ